MQRHSRFVSYIDHTVIALLTIAPLTIALLTVIALFACCYLCGHCPSSPLPLAGHCHCLHQCCSCSLSPSILVLLIIIITLCACHCSCTMLPIPTCWSLLLILLLSPLLSLIQFPLPLSGCSSSPCILIAASSALTFQTVICFVILH